MAALPKRDSMDATAALDEKVAATTLASPPTNALCPPPRKLGLPDLPPSVRNTIYKYALDTELVNDGAAPVSYKHTLRDGMLHFSASRSPFPVTTALFYVSKAVSVSAREYFYSRNLFVRLEIYTADARHAKTLVEDSGLLFSVGAPEHVARSTQHALDVVLVEKNSSVKRAAVLFPAQYLPRLINFLHQASQATRSWAPGHTLFVGVVNAYGFAVSRLQGDLLEGFRLLANLGGATVDAGLVLPRYTEGLARDMTAARFEAEAWLESVAELADLADEAREKEDYEMAAEYGQAVVVALTYGYLMHAETLHSQDAAFATHIQRLRWRTELGLGIALSLQHRSLSSTKGWLDTRNPSPSAVSAAAALLRAETSVSKALSLATDAPSPASNPWFRSIPVELIPPNKAAWFSDQERAQTWFALGTVHAALGEYVFAAGDLERAMGLWEEGDAVGKERVERAFEAAREGIDGDAEGMWEGTVRPGSGLRRAARVAAFLS